MSAREEAQRERVARGVAILEQYAIEDGGRLDDGAWMYAAAAIADLLHAVEAFGLDEVTVDRVLDLAMLHHEEEVSA